MTRISVGWHKQKDAGYSFLAKDSEGNSIDFNADEIINDDNIQTTSSQAVLMALGTSIGSDVISILTKQDQIIDDFKVCLEGVRTAQTWLFVTIAYDLKGLVGVTKAREACIRSLRKQCTLVEILKRAGACIEWQLTVNNVSFTHIMEQAVPITAK
jgi:putative redox protein